MHEVPPLQKAKSEVIHTHCTYCTYCQSDKWTDRHTNIHWSLYARMHGHIRPNIQTNKKEIRKFTDCHIYIHVHTHTHTHAHTDNDPPQSIPLFGDNFWTLVDFQGSGDNRAKLCFELLRPSLSQCIGL